MLLDELAFDKTKNTADINECLAEVDISRKHKRQLSALTKEDVFRDWLTKESGSSRLVIYGHMDTDEYVTPISYLAAKIGEYYHGKRGFIVLNYFCGLHGNSQSSGMMKSIIGQLLSQGERLLGNRLSIRRNEFKGLKRGNVDALTAVFEDLIEQFQSSRVIIFCLVDSISTFETAERIRDTKKVIRSLCRIASSLRGDRRGSSDRIKMILKLLISDGQASQIADKYVKYDELHEISGDAEEASESELGVESEDVDESGSDETAEFSGDD